MRTADLTALSCFGKMVVETVRRGGDLSLDDALLGKLTAFDLDAVLAACREKAFPMGWTLGLIGDWRRVHGFGPADLGGEKFERAILDRQDARYEE